MTDPPPTSAVLEALTAEEKAQVLEHLVAVTPSVGHDAAAHAWALLGEVAVEDVAVGVSDALLALD